jgi:hypothetical protein
LKRTYHTTPHALTLPGATWRIEIDASVDGSRADSALASVSRSKPTHSELPADRAGASRKVDSIVVIAIQRKRQS